MSPHPRRSRGFTLVEILVVVAIIVILMAILIPTAMKMIGNARNAAIGVELSQLKAALEDYKKEHGDYPPSMDWDTAFATTVVSQAQRFNATNRYNSICERHLLRCYPKAIDKDKFYSFIAPYIEQDEALVFWLSMIANDPREPFKNFVWVSPNTYVYYYGGNDTSRLNFNDFPGAYTRFVHYEFDSRRLDDGDGDGIPGYTALYSKGTTYMYFDSRTYGFSQNPNYAPRANMVATNGVAQPFTDAVAINKGQPRFMNPNTFQIQCAGQDGNYGGPTNPSALGATGVIWANTRMFPTMINCTEEDSDNLADFTEGRKLIDHRAP